MGGGRFRVEMGDGGITLSQKKFFVIYVNAIASTQKKIMIIMNSIESSHKKNNTLIRICIALLWSCA